MGDAAHQVDAEIERLVEQALPVWEAQQTVLRKRDQLHVDQPAKLFPNLDQRAHPEQ